MTADKAVVATIKILTSAVMNFRMTLPEFADAAVVAAASCHSFRRSKIGLRGARTHTFPASIDAAKIMAAWTNGEQQARSDG